MESTALFLAALEFRAHTKEEKWVWIQGVIKKKKSSKRERLIEKQRANRDSD